MSSATLEKKRVNATDPGAEKPRFRLRPIGDRVLVEPLEPMKTIPGGKIILSDGAAGRSTKGIVVEVGEGKKTGNLLDVKDNETGEIVGAIAERLPIDLKIGDLVMFDEYAGKRIEIEGYTAVLFHEEEILVCIRQE